MISSKRMWQCSASCVEETTSNVSISRILWSGGELQDQKNMGYTQKSVNVDVRGGLHTSLYYTKQYDSETNRTRLFKARVQTGSPHTSYPRSRADWIHRCFTATPQRLGTHQPLNPHATLFSKHIRYAEDGTHSAQHYCNVRVSIAFT